VTDAKLQKTHFNNICINMQWEQLYVLAFVFLDGHHCPAKDTKGNQYKVKYISPIQAHILPKYIFCVLSTGCDRNIENGLF
jgi:hypothetical protein